MTSSDNTESALSFPCVFPIKVMGDVNEDIETFVKNTLASHLEPNAEIEIKTRQSKGGNYVSVTATFTATSRNQLDTLYTALSAHDAVKMVL